MARMWPRSPLLGVVAVAIALAAHGELLVRLRQAEPARPWWFGYARDGVNLAAALMSWGGYMMMGLGGPDALLAGMLTTLATYVLDWTLARGLKLPHPRLLLAVPLAAWIAFLALAPTVAGRLFTSLLALGHP